MTTTIRATCPDCGEVEVTPADVRLRVCRDRSQSFYAFACSSCSDDVYKPADDHVIALLTSGGVPVVEWDVPDELLAGPHPGPPLTLDYAIDLHADVEAHNAAAGASDAPSVSSGPNALDRVAAAFRRVTP